MKSMIVLMRREWLEWKRVVIGTVLVITFLNLLMLLSVARGSSWFHDTLKRDGSINMNNVEFSEDKTGNLHITKEGDSVRVTFESEAGQNHLDQMLDKATLPVAFGIRIGMQGIFLFVLFLSLFYFSDAIFKERADNSTLFYRSLPVGDHLLLFSKILAGLIGVMGLTIFLSLEYLLFMRLAVLVWGDPLNTMAAEVFGRLSIIGLIWDWFSYLLYAVIRMAPLAVFLMLVGAYVKGRPLLVGIGGPLLVSISWSIVFKSAALFKIIGRFFMGFNMPLIDQLKSIEETGALDTELYANPWDYVFNLDTLLAVMASALLYYGLWLLYRKNEPTG